MVLFAWLVALIAIIGMDGILITLSIFSPTNWIFLFALVLLGVCAVFGAISTSAPPRNWIRGYFFCLGGVLGIIVSLQSRTNWMASLLATLKSFLTNNWLFLSIFGFRYLRFVVNFITGVFLYRPTFSSGNDRFSYKHVAVIIPTVAPNTQAFQRCCESILVNLPAVLIVCTVGAQLELDVKEILKNLEVLYPQTSFIALSTKEANKRRQVVAASKHIDMNKTPITICVDDHVFWQPTMITSLLPAFNNPQVGLVGTGKKVIRNKTHFSIKGLVASFTNFIACLYLERDNFRIRSEPYIDGGVFCVSGRTSAIRTEILQDQDYQRGYSNEMFFFGMFGPLNPDDDNYGVRWVLRNGWKIAFQLTPECQIVTPLGESSKFCLREWKTYRNQPWSVYAIYFSQMLNLALVWDPLLLWTLTRTSLYTETSHRSLLITAMVTWIFFSKMVKIAPHFYDHPTDLFWLPAYLCYAYWHSLVKFYCAVTFWNHTWGGRNLKVVAETSFKSAQK